MSTKSSNTAVNDRRPLKTRGQQWARSLASRLARANITPNQISFLSIAAAVLCLLLLWASAHTEAVSRAAFFIAAAMACQLRLLCNLMDGMVAIEGGKETPDGPLWNEFPDRVADVVILVGLGIASDAMLAGWAAASLAVTIAYVRELGKGLDGHVDYGGPMAKPHRMALVTAVLLLAAVVLWLSPGSVSERYASRVLQVGLWVCIAGGLLTVWRRTRHIQRRLLRS